MQYNQYHQAIGDAVPDFCAGEKPQIERLTGQYCALERLSSERHLDDICTFYGTDSPPEQWTYLTLDAFPNRQAVQAYLQKIEALSDPYHLAIVDLQDNRVVGTFALMAVDTAHRSIEMGWVIYSPRLQRSRIATEAQFLAMRYVFETLHYRRYEWKCDSLNQASVQAAQRLGFQLEGIFRNARVYKGRNRDTAYFSMLPEEYAHMKPKLEQWLSPDNFDQQGKQIRRLAECG